MIAFVVPVVGFLATLTLLAGVLLDWALHGLEDPYDPEGY